jgi:hypothetical protein
MTETVKEIKLNFDNADAESANGSNLEKESGEVNERESAARQSQGTIEHES